MAIYTIGYQNMPLQAFIQQVRRARVQLIADVRDFPLSRKRGFSKTSLSAALTDAGVRYRHIRELGCPKPIRDRYHADGDWGRYTSSFMSHLCNQQVAIQELARLCASDAVALLCYEADSSRCHRTYVARAVAAILATPVAHIGASGITAEHIAAPRPFLS